MSLVRFSLFFAFQYLLLHRKKVLVLQKDGKWPVVVLNHQRLVEFPQLSPITARSALIRALSSPFHAGINSAPSDALPEDTFVIVVKEKPPPSEWF